MTKAQARIKLERRGYTVTVLMQGGYVAKKNQRTYSSETLNGLCKMIFGRSWVWAISRLAD